MSRRGDSAGNPPDLPSVIVGEESDVDLEPQPGEVLSERYVLEAQLGQGGMGWVWRARDLELGRAVAVKILLPSHARVPEVLERFNREARGVAALDHPNVVPVYDVGRDGRLSYFVMKLLSGEPLHRILEHSQLSVPVAIDLCRQILDGLDHLHQRGLVHRDVKPGNVIVSPDGHATIVDFGILRGPSHEPRVTTAGLFVGTPEYIAPELVRSEPGEARTDLYSLGVLLYEVLTGDVPFAGETAIEIVTRHLRDPAPRPSSVRAGLSPELDAIVLRALAKRPEDRFGSAVEMRAALDQVRAGIESRRPPDGREAPTQHLRIPKQPLLSWRVVAMVAGVAIVIGVIGLAVQRSTAVPAPTPSAQPLPRPMSASQAVSAGRPRLERQPVTPEPVAVPAPELVPAGSAPPDPLATDARPSDASAVKKRGRRVEATRSKEPGRPLPEHALEPAAAGGGSVLERARAALRAGAASQAVALFQQAVREAPGSAAPFRGLGDAYLAIGNRTAATAAYRRYLALSPAARDRATVERRLEQLGAR